MGSNPADLIYLDGSDPYNFKTQGWVATTVSGGITTYDINYAYITSSVSSLSFTVPGTSTTYSSYYSGTSFAADFAGEISSAVQTAVQTILAPAGTVADTNYFSDVANISFTKQDPTAASVQIDIGTTNNAHSELPAHHSVIPDAGSLSTALYNPGEYGDIWLNSAATLDGSYGWGNTTTSSDTALPGSEAFEDLIHELGHSLGLTHATTAGGNNLLYYTVMTASGWELPGMSVGVSGLQEDDIRAIQSIYGANYSIRSGEDVYGVGHGFGATASTQFVDTIWDGGGVNVIDASSYSGPSFINLNEAAFSSIGPGNANGGTWTQPLGSDFNGIAYSNVAIAYGTIIQNAIGTQGSTTFIGNLWNNVLAGAHGSSGNTFYSDQTVYNEGLGPGIDWSYNHNPLYVGSQWNDPNYTPIPTLKDDVLIGDGSGNTFNSGTGNNVIDGGYNATDINNATSSWGTYWDSAYQFTADPVDEGGAANNISGTPLANVADSSATGNSVSYLNLSLDDTVVNGYGAGVFIRFSGLDAGGDPEYFVGKGRGSYIDGTDKLINIQSIELSAGFNTYSQIGGAAADLLLEGVSGQTGPTNYLIKMGTNEGTTVGTVSIYDPNPGSAVYFQATTGDPVQGIEVSHVSTYVAGFPVTDDIVNITTQSLSGESTSTNLDVTAMASGAIGMVCVATLPVTGAQFAAWVLSDPSELGTMLTPSAFQSDVAGTSTPGGLAPPATYDSTTGSITGMVAPTYASSGEVVDPTIATEIDHPWVVTSSSVSGSTTTANVVTSAEALQMLEPASDIRIVWSGPTSDNLTVYAISEAKSFTVPHFVDGTAVTGIATLDNVTYGNIAPTVTSIVAFYAGGYEFSFTSPITIPTTSVSVTELLEQMTFSDNTSWNMQSGGLTFTAAVDSQTLYSRDGFNDTLVAACNYNTLNGSSGNTTMVAGVACTINNGTGTDTDIFTAGAAPTSYGGDYVYANTSGGTTSIHLQGIDPSAVTMWDTTGGALAIQYSSTDVIHIQGGAYSSSTGLTLEGVSEITFDSSYATTISLTGGLNLTATADYQTIYGTSGGGDTLTANGTGDTLMAFAGTETLVAGPGATLDNGSGTDTDVFSAGAAPISSGGDYVYTDTSGGTGNIHLHGIDPSAVTMWDTSGGQLVIQYSSTDQIHVLDGAYSSSTGLTLAGLNEITFDSSYATTWDTTGGLHLTAASDYQTLYGTSGGGDTLTASGTGDTLMAFAGAETLVVGHGAQIYNGTGNDIDVINSGSSPTSSTATIFANSSGGSDNVIALHDVVASDITMWDTTGGNLIIATPTDQVTVAGGSYSGTTGFAVGNIDHIALDDSSTINLQGGLNLTAVSDSQTIYGTGHGDNMTAAGNYDNLNGIAGNNTMTGNSDSASYTYFNGGSGNDLMIAEGGTNYMTAGTGADVYKIETASSSTTVDGFSIGKGDVLNFQDILESTSVLSNVGNFVQESTSGSNTQFSVDPTGAAHFTSPLVTLDGVTGLADVATLVANGHLIVHS